MGLDGKFITQTIAGSHHKRPRMTAIQQSIENLDRARVFIRRAQGIMKASGYGLHAEELGEVEKHVHDYRRALVKLRSIMKTMETL